MTSLFQKGKELGFTPDQVRAMIRKERMYLEILECESLEDIKILLMHWIEQGTL